METQIDSLRRAAALLEPDAATRADWLVQVAAFAGEFLDRVPDDPVFVAEPAGGRGLVAAGIPAAGRSLDDILTLFDREVLGSGINPTSGRFFGYIPGGGLYASALGDYLAAVTNRFAGVFFASPGAVRLENHLLRWMADEVVGFPATAAGNLASGGSVANLAAIVTARDAHGVSGTQLPRSVVYSTVHAHHCIDKALHIAGLSRCVRRIVPVDSHYRMDAAALSDAVRADKAAGLAPWLVVANAGTTNTGAVDPLAAIADISAAEGLWLHVDGAYGAYFNLCPEGRARLQAMSRADSVVMDPHKTLFLPYGTGALLVRDGGRLLTSHGAEADYMGDILDAGEELSPADLSPELTRHFRGLRLWLPLQLAGVDAFRAALSEKIQLARGFHTALRAEPGFEVGPYPDLSVVTYRYVPPRGDVDAFNLALTRAIQQDGRVFVSDTQLDGRVVLRLAVVCFRSHQDEVALALDVIRSQAATLAGTCQMTNTVEIQRVCKSFGRVEAVRDISFVVRPGEIFGLLGPNGAGKTTTIRMLLDILRPDAGEIAVFGGPLTAAGKDRIGYLPEERGLYAQLKLLDVIVYLGSLKGLRRRDARARAEPLLRRLGLWEYRKKKLSELSRGMHQKAQFIVTILHDPDLIIVDEPFAGLDPVNTQLIQEMIAELRIAGKTIMMSTHQLHQVEALCERMVLIHRGTVQLAGGVRAVREQFAGNELLVEGEGPIDSAPGVVGAQRVNGQWRLTLADDLDPAQFLSRLVGNEGVRVTHFAQALPTLSDIFIRVVGAEAPDG